jgi:hypothetical protein
MGERRKLGCRTLAVFKGACFFPCLTLSGNETSVSFLAPTAWQCQLAPLPERAKPNWS